MMKTPDVSQFNIGPRLTLTFAILLAVILGGNGLLLWQFHIARLQTIAYRCQSAGDLRTAAPGKSDIGARTAG